MPLDKKELAQCNRFKKIRTALRLKQSDFAKDLTISQGHASDIENGRKKVSDSLVEILYLKYDVNEKWLREGEGEMFIPKTRSEIIAEFAADVIKENDTFRRRLVEALAVLNENEWEFLANIAEKMIKKEGQVLSPSPKDGQ